MKPLTIMVAPNGARRMPSDHANLPITIEATARACAEVHAGGAQAVHVHVRDAQGLHTLDADLYKQASLAIRREAGADLVLQITTEAVGRFTPAEQIATVRAVRPEAVSIALKELIPDEAAMAEGADLYSWAHREGVAVQHILYSVEETERFVSLVARGVLPGERHSVIFPLGRYAAGQESNPAELIPLLACLDRHGRLDRTDWMVCAFGRAETPSLVGAAALGGECRIGFENSFFNADGTRAESNAERLADLRRGLAGVPRPRANRDDALRALGRPF
jgi:uncharacterized protein (DUF849 family)